MILGSLKLSHRDRQILDCLTQKVRMISAEQAAATWWTANRDAACHAGTRLDALVTAGVLGRHEVFSVPLLAHTEPVLSWRPGQAQPTDDDFGAAAYRLKTRWPDEPAGRWVVYTATRQLANRIGGFEGGIPYRDQVSHDLHVTELYLRLLRSEPEAAHAWRGEELGKRDQAYAEKLPDAVLVDAEGRPYQAIEFGGRYAKARVRAFCDHCFARRLGFDLW